MMRGRSPEEGRMRACRFRSMRRSRRQERCRLADPTGTFSAPLHGLGASEDAFGDHFDLLVNHEQSGVVLN
jgi:hypothetical protein